MNESEAAKVVAILHAHDPKHPTTDATVTAWAMAMDDVPYPAAMIAVRAWMKHHKWFPFPSELRGMLAEQLTGLPTTDVAWGLVQQRMRQTYPGQSAPPWDVHGAIIEATQRIGGVNALRMSNSPLKDQDRFTEIYNAIRERVLQEADIPGLWMQLQSANRLVAAADSGALGTGLNGGL